jgi:hypothetical protein
MELVERYSHTQNTLVKLGGAIFKTGELSVKNANFTSNSASDVGVNQLFQPACSNLWCSAPLLYCLCTASTLLPRQCPGFSILPTMIFLRGMIDLSGRG